MIEGGDCVIDILSVGNNLNLRYTQIDLNLQNQR